MAILWRARNRGAIMPSRGPARKSPPAAVAQIAHRGRPRVSAPGIRPPADPAPRVADHRAAVLTGAMPVEGEYEPSTRAWVREQVDLYESSGGTQGTTLRDTGLPVVIITNRGARSGKLRKTPVMRVEYDGRYAAVASQGGAPTHPFWYYNLRAHPRVELQDGPRK
jgi:F420H(2)-dependent quinone reductase